MDPALPTGVDDADDKDEDTSLTGVPVPNTTIMTNTDNKSDTESDHSSVHQSSKASTHSTRSHICICSATREPPQHPLDEEANLSKDETKPDNIELPQLETQVPVLC